MDHAKGVPSGKEFKVTETDGREKRMKKWEKSLLFTCFVSGWKLYVRFSMLLL